MAEKCSVCMCVDNVIVSDASARKSRAWQEKDGLCLDGGIHSSLWIIGSWKQHPFCWSVHLNVCVIMCVCVGGGAVCVCPGVCVPLCVSGYPLSASFASHHPPVGADPAPRFTRTSLLPGKERPVAPVVTADHPDPQVTDRPPEGPRSPGLEPDSS